MKHEIIEIPVISEAIRKLGAPTSALSRVDGHLYTCGMPPIDLATGEIVRGNIATQTRASLEALSFTLQHAGSSLDNVFKSLVFITDNALAAEMNAVYREYFPNYFPARSCVAIKPWALFDHRNRVHRNDRVTEAIATGNRIASHKRTQCLSLDYTLIGGTAAGTAMILLFLPALYAVWFRIKPPKQGSHRETIVDESRFTRAMAAE